MGNITHRIAHAASAIAVMVAIVTSGFLFQGGDARAADASRGQLLYENHCMVCHTSVVHVREHRKASSREDIEAWIRRWQKELALSWAPREIADVAEFLNQRYYQLEKDS
jgi:mono/diheme cytochrome c family protein